MKIFNEDGSESGYTTSGTISPSCGGIGMGYVHKDSNKVGTKHFVDVRGKKVEVSVVKLPFIKPGYFRVK